MIDLAFLMQCMAKRAKEEQAIEDHRLHLFPLERVRARSIILNVLAKAHP